MVNIRKEVSFYEYPTYISVCTNWFVRHDNELVVLHSKTRMIDIKEDRRVTYFSSWDCKAQRTLIEHEMWNAR